MTGRGAEAGTPPGGGRWDHEWMREAMLRPITGPGSTDTLAASGGLELPAHQSHPEPSHTSTAPEPIPGERDVTTLTWRARPGRSEAAARAPTRVRPSRTR
jgi:hypothetical protein